MTAWPVAHQAPLFLGFSREEYWSGLPFPPPRDHPNPGITPTSPGSPALAGRLSIPGPPVKPIVNKVCVRVCILSGFFVILWTITLQTPLSMGLSREEYWSGYSPLQGSPSSRGPQYCYLNFRLDRDFPNCPSNVLYCERKHRKKTHCIPLSHL